METARKDKKIIDCNSVPFKEDEIVRLLKDLNDDIFRARLDY